MAFVRFVIITTALLVSESNYVIAKVECNSSASDGNQDGLCTGDYCFNIENKIRGCFNTYRMLRDDNIACGHMHLMGAPRKVCVCTQAYCGKYDVANMPTQTLATVNCTDDYSDLGYCSPGPCYVGNDLARYGANASDPPVMQRTCMQDWFAVTDFKELIMYEVPPLANHAACFFDSDGEFNCMCKDPGCNQKQEPSLAPASDGKYFTCHKSSCQIGDSGCDDSHTGTQNCVGHMCYYLKAVYDFNLDGKAYKQSRILRDCLNYSHPDPIVDLTFATGFEFGNSRGVFYPCSADFCNAKPHDLSSAAPALTTMLTTLVITMAIVQLSSSILGRG